MRLLIKNATFIDDNFKIKSNQDILIKDGIIDYIGEVNDKLINFIDGSNFFLVPGFANAHFHLGETIFRGNSPRDSLKNYLKYTSNFSKRLNDEESHKIISEFSLLETLNNGTSLISCARGWKPTQDCGIRGLLGYPLMKSTKLSDYYVNFQEKFKRLKKDYPKKFSNGTVQISFCLWLHSINYLDQEILPVLSKMFKEDNKLRMTIHLAETEEMQQEVQKRFGLSEVELLDKYNLLNEKTNLVHAIHIDKKDIQIMVKQKVNVTICPVSNIFLNSGLPNLKELLENKINVSIATDGLATNYSASLLETAKITYLLYRDLDLTPEELFKMITINPAKTLGFDNCGSIKVGNCADINFFNIDDSSLLPKEHLLSNLIFGHALKSELIMINGEIVSLKDKKKIIKDFGKLVRGPHYGKN